MDELDGIGFSGTWKEPNYKLFPYLMIYHSFELLTLA